MQGAVNGILCLFSAFGVAVAGGENGLLSSRLCQTFCRPPISVTFDPRAKGCLQTSKAQLEVVADPPKQAARPQILQATSPTLQVPDPDTSPQNGIPNLQMSSTLAWLMSYIPIEDGRRAFGYLILGPMKVNARDSCSGIYLKEMNSRLQLAYGYCESDITQRPTKLNK